MLKTIKTISFTLLILTLSLVLSACGNKIISEPQENITGEQNIENQNNDQNQESISEEVQENESEELENQQLDISKWRSYENEYFNLKFKYHQSWYFQRDSLNQGDYIAVYGFAPSLEELQNKDYSIKLFILNSDNSFSEEFIYSQEKESGNKKYVLASNQKEVKDVLDLMFENLEIVDDEEVSEEVEESKEEISLNTYINEEYGFSLEFPQAWNEYNVKINDNHIYFGIPVQDSLFVISVFFKDDWQQIQSEEGPKPTYLNEDNQYVFGYSRAQDYVDTAIPRSKEVPVILSTFKFTN